MPTLLLSPPSFYIIILSKALAMQITYYLFLEFQEHIVPFVANNDSFCTLNNANSSTSFRETTHNII